MKNADRPMCPVCRCPMRESLAMTRGFICRPCALMFWSSAQVRDESDGEGDSVEDRGDWHARVYREGRARVRDECNSTEATSATSMWLPRGSSVRTTGGFTEEARLETWLSVWASDVWASDGLASDSPPREDTTFNIIYSRLM